MNTIHIAVDATEHREMPFELSLNGSEVHISLANLPADSGEDLARLDRELAIANKTNDLALAEIAALEADLRELKQLYENALVGARRNSSAFDRMLADERRKTQSAVERAGELRCRLDRIMAEGAHVDLAKTLLAALTAGGKPYARRIDVFHAVRQVTSLDLQEAKALVDQYLYETPTPRKAVA